MDKIDLCKNPVIAVVGPMASGKNTLCSLLEKKGCKSIDADILVHKIIDKLSEEIFSTFKDEAECLNIELKNPNGSINRRALGKLLFSFPVLLEKQENIVYPELINLISGFLRENENFPRLINATLLFKTQSLMEKCTFIMYVHSPLVIRFLRAKKRDKISSVQILKRFYSQRKIFNSYKKTKIPIIKIKNAADISKIEKKLTSLFKVGGEQECH